MCFTLEEISEHRADCWQCTRADFSQIITAQITIYNCIIKCCLSIGWQRSRSEGWTISMPIFRYRPIVPRDSSAFLPIEKAINEIRVNYNMSIQDIKRTLSTTLADLRQIFGDKGSPFDVDQVGNGLFSVSNSEFDVVAYLTYIGPPLVDCILYQSRSARCSTPLLLSRHVY